MKDFEWFDADGDRGELRRGPAGCDKMVLDAETNDYSDGASVYIDKPTAKRLIKLLVDFVAAP